MDKFFWEAEGALSKPTGAIFPPKLENLYQAPDTYKSMLSPREYLWRFVAFAKVRERAQINGEHFHFGQKRCAQKIKPDKFSLPQPHYHYLRHFMEREGEKVGKSWNFIDFAIIYSIFCRQLQNWKKTKASTAVAGLKSLASSTAPQMPAADAYKSTRL